MFLAKKRHLATGIFTCALLLFTTACTPQAETGPENFTIGLITNSQNGLRNIQGFKDGMSALGYIEGQNVTYLFAGTPIGMDSLERELQDLVAAGVDLIFTAGTPTGVAAYRVTTGTTIPVVFGVIANPIEAGVMTDLQRPGGNMTGVMLSENQGRRLELLQEIAPGIKRVFVPYDPADTASTSAVSQIDRLAPGLGLELVKGLANDENAVMELFQNFPQDIDAIFMVPGTRVNAHLDDLVAIAAERRLPLSGPSTAQVEEGALITYGFIHHEAGAQAARIADQILKGTRPGDIPVEVADFFLAVNLPMAETIGLDIPYSLLQRATIIIRAGE